MAPPTRCWSTAAWEGAAAIGLMYGTPLPPDTNPTDVASLTAPRLIELCFQTAALWSVQTRQAMAFPLGIESVAVYHQPVEAVGRLYCLCHTADNGETYDCAGGGCSRQPLRRTEGVPDGGATRSQPDLIGEYYFFHLRSHSQG